jgi:hypothetical protein
MRLARDMLCREAREAQRKPENLNTENMTTEIKPLKKAISGILPYYHIQAMIDAMTKSGAFTISKDLECGTISAYHTATGREVFAAIQKTASQWIYRHHAKLFS